MVMEAIVVAAVVVLGEGHTGGCMHTMGVIKRGLAWARVRVSLAKARPHLNLH